MMERNANLLQRLINQILDLTKLEAGKLQLKATELNAVFFVRSFIQSFESLARQREIDLKFHSEREVINVFADKEKLEQIINRSKYFGGTPRNTQLLNITMRESSYREGC